MEDMSKANDRLRKEKEVVENYLEKVRADRARLRAALEKIAAFGPNSDTDEGHLGLAPWAELALNPQKAVEIAEEALKAEGESK